MVNFVKTIDDQLSQNTENPFLASLYRPPDHLDVTILPEVQDVLVVTPTHNPQCLTTHAGLPTRSNVTGSEMAGGN
jgi:hypothetical protein